eukprot:7913722-Prorocentrum_lima.AAC.1
MVDSRGAALLHVDRLEARLSLAERRHNEATENMEMKQFRWKTEIEEERRTRMAKDEAEQRSRLQSAVH